jgi:hypothetical protein
MPNHLRVLPIIAMLVATFPSAQAGVMTYSDEASFLDAIDPFYLESFDGLTTNSDPAELTLGPSNGFGYRVSAVKGLFVVAPNGDVALSTNTYSDDLNVTMDQGVVTAFGGWFFPTDASGNSVAGNVGLSFDLIGGTAWSTTVAKGDFFGLTSSLAITDVTVTAPGSVYPTLDDLYVGSASKTSAAPAPAPAPATAALLALGLLVVGMRRAANRG